MLSYKLLQAVKNGRRKRAAPKSYHNQVTLNRLSNRESLAMVAYLLSAEDLDKGLEIFASVGKKLGVI